MPAEDEIQQACKVVRKGGIIAYPTEAVYGLGCDPLNQQAVERIARLKSRERSKRFILISANTNQLKTFCDISNPEFIKRIGNTWPGPTTWIFPARDICPQWLYDEALTVAVRVSAHPTVVDLCNQCNSTLISTSANLAGQVPAHTPAQVRDIFGSAIDYIVGGVTGGLARPTQIINVVNGQVIRQ